MSYRGLLLGLLLVLTGCAARTPLPEQLPELSSDLPLSLIIARSQPDAPAQSWLLVLQAEGPSLRWSLFDPLGIPLARQLLNNGAWHNDGLLPPNDEARELFAALLFALSQPTALSKHYAAEQWRAVSTSQRWLTPDWQISYRAPLDFTLHNDHGLRYDVQAPALEEGS